MECFPDGLYGFVGAGHLPASSCGWNEGGVIEQLPAFGTRDTFHSLICNNHIL